MTQDNNNLKLRDELTLKNTKITRTFEGKDYTLNLSIEKKEAKYIFDFNYHFEINALEKFNEIFDIQKFMELKEYSINLLFDLCQLEMED